MRLHEETEFRPKTHIPIGDRPIILHIMRTYLHYGFSDFVLCTGYRGKMIKDYFLNYDNNKNSFTMKMDQKVWLEYTSSPRDLIYKVTIVDRGCITMTAGRINGE